MLAFLGLGMTEVLLILAIFLILFGADKVPQIARSLGKLQGEFNKAYREFNRELETAEQKALREQTNWERYRDEQVRMASPEYQEEQAVKSAAQALDIPTKGRSVADLKREIAQRMGPPPGEGSPPPTKP
ncbi:MAG TPA: twin-arginine translocase TatA/TatE family subunit [Candidatus Thermoplasmatota archaeon]|nr:twin-arginine translocase TatA/TatE family subunit [Candidatus Thermoplasmatota archaeon]